MELTVLVRNKLLSSHGLGLYDRNKGGFAIKSFMPGIAKSLSVVGVEIGFDLDIPTDVVSIFRSSSEMKAMTGVKCGYSPTKYDHQIGLFNFTTHDVEFPSGFVFGHVDFKVSSNNSKQIKMRPQQKNIPLFKSCIVPSTIFC